MKPERRKTRQIHVGGIPIGGDAPIVVQSMTTTDTRDIQGTIEQIHQLENAGCEIVRVAVPTKEDAQALPKIKAAIRIPMIADIHFDHRLALAATEIVDCVRINPGNIGSRAKLREVVKAVEDRGIPLRVGVNAGSLERELLQKYGYPTAEAMVESAVTHVKVIEDFGFTNMKVSLKASDVHLAVDAYRLFSEAIDYPVHLGITEAGTSVTGTIKSSVGLGLLLAAGIGDTLRVSLAADPCEEVRVGFEILKALELRHRGVNVIACPTCGRLEIDVINIANNLERRLAHIKEPITVSVLGCVVNGIGEGKEADIGIAGGQGVGILFREGKLVRKVKADDLEEVLVEEVEALAISRQEKSIQEQNRQSTALEDTHVSSA
ncbi:MAG TPA: flavodoxin-dependent (E)-4-hydroxy-3-methylbut-2-enyl-diphosphate synthase [Nitrospirales bacterium]|nr:flavodoxin-dependent (E)-4-hydroxy-3-methylbut-2-enyl-diphosphate synthase [Nitrospirales bacterium]HIC05217.1 flavodoxin-dependent (E)-4-hydroxy-3-methylbut-2-enyl-diphosphate synthase [Nitrospirales bacterium]